ncbi:hypothetical protein [Schlesneria paludicola]|uniref:hypothetical protein n=1 Tax=Schlesneria paludicola TaxID=360056 RepID=UPI00029B0375|nr:hypothetical protein [Schlesneria paludicola]
MSFQAQSVHWNQQRPIREVIAEVQAQGAEYVIVESESNPTVSANLAAASTNAADLIVFRTAADAGRWKSLGECLPKGLYFLAAVPSGHSAVAISVPLLAAHQNVVTAAGSLNELVARLAAFATVSFVDAVVDGGRSTFACPRLIQSAGGGRHGWVQELIDAIPAGKDRAAVTAVTALKAGLHLMNEDFDASHACSQSIEGMGANRTGDYWHAILHRREPDYGNAKYWFRHVGRHPAYVELAQLVERRLNAADASLPAKLESWRGMLLPQGKWDPFAFVDLCAAAEHDNETRAWCEVVQYDEMVVLLESTARDVINNTMA